MRRLAIWCVSAAAACSSEDPGQIMNVGSEDAMSVFTGLTLDFTADAQLPAEIAAEVRIDDIYLNGSMIRAIGDATTQGELSTTGRDHELHWSHDDAPRPLEFSSAPLGEYAYVQIRIAGRPYPNRSDAFEIHGEARVGGDWTDFVIRADAPTVVANVPASMRLEASRPLTIPLELDVDKLVAGLDFAALPKRDGKLRLDEQTPAQLAIFTGALAGAFRAR
jgi:hypothetical protein